MIEEQARGSAEKADAIRADIAGLIGHDLSKLKPGSPEAMEIKAKLISRGAWSQYLEVGIGPDAEIFTKCQPMASVGFGADVGLHPVSTWNNPEPEIAMIAASSGRIVGATIGNDVNLRDVEGRSALLLGKAKDNNASASLGPFIRLFDDKFSIDDVKRAVVRLKVEGEDGFSLEGASSMAEISRSPEELVAAAMGPHHQYRTGWRSISAPCSFHPRIAARRARDLPTRSATSSPSRRKNSVRWSTGCGCRPTARTGPTAPAT